MGKDYTHCEQMVKSKGQIIASCDRLVEGKRSLRFPVPSSVLHHPSLLPVKLRTIPDKSQPCTTRTTLIPSLLCLLFFFPSAWRFSVLSCLLSSTQWCEESLTFLTATKEHNEAVTRHRDEAARCRQEWTKVSQQLKEQCGALLASLVWVFA